MKILPVMVFLACQFFTASAQQKNFLYIQTDNKQPFYVKKEGVVYSSSMSGYVVLPSLADTTYALQVGFPRNEKPEQQFVYKVSGKDQGFVLKDFGEKGWGLFNLQTMNVLMATSSGAQALPDDTEVASAPPASPAANPSSAAVVVPPAKSGASLTVAPAARDTSGPAGRQMAAPGGFIDRLAMVVDDASIRIKPKVTPKVTAKPAAPAPSKKDTLQQSLATGPAKKDKEKKPVVTAAPVPPVEKNAVAQETADNKQAAVKNETKQEEAAKAAGVIKETDLAKAGEETVVKEENTVTAEVPARQEEAPLSLPKSNVIKKSMTELQDGYMGIFIDEYANGDRDTIRVFVSKAPFPGEGKNKPADGINPSPAAGDTGTINTQQEQEKSSTPPKKQQQDVRFLDFSVKQQEDDQDKAAKRAVDSARTAIPAVSVSADTLTTVTPAKPVNSDSTDIVVPADTLVAADDNIQATDSLQVKTDVVLPDIPGKTDSLTIKADSLVVITDTTAADKAIPATEEDFRELRRKMAAEETEDDMVYVARKYFRSKKFKTEQIRHLAALFLKEEGLYRFLDAAYPFVADKNEYASLSTLLRDPYYINRFKAMLVTPP